MKKEATINTKRNKNGSYSVFLQYCREGVYLKSVGITLSFNETQLDFFKRKSRIPSSIPNYDLFNEKIAKEENDLNATINKYFKTYSRYPTKIELESYIKYCEKPKEVDTQNFIVCFNEFIKMKQSSKDVKQYITLLHHFERYQQTIHNKKIHFSDLQVGFFMEFFTFLSQKSKLLSKGKKNQKIDVCDNALIKLSYNLASAINGIRKYKIAADINDREIKDNIQLAIERINAIKYNNVEIVLSHHEVEELVNFKLADEYKSNKSTKGKDLKVTAEVLERIKYLFVLQTIKGTRHSDVHQLCLDKLLDNKISILQKKTLHQHSVPIDDQTIELMERSQSKLKISNQKYNEYLKLVFKQFFPYYKERFKKDDINYKLDGIEQIKFYLGEQQITYKKRYELAKTHMARRTYVSVGKIFHKLSDLEIQHDIGQTNPNSLKPYKVYYEESERPKVFNLSIKD